jgi:hypothetical protein
MPFSQTDAEGIFILSGISIQQALNVSGIFTCSDVKLPWD